MNPTTLLELSKPSETSKNLSKQQILEIKIYDGRFPQKKMFRILGYPTLLGPIIGLSTC